MLLKKKKFHLNYYIKKNTNNKLILTITLNYKLFKKDLFINYISLYLFYFLKNKIKLFYCYTIKINIPNKTIFNSIITIFSNWLKVFFLSQIKFKLIKKSKKYYTILRSPFVYKKSQEHYFSESFIGKINVNLNYNSFYFVKFWENFLLKIMYNFLISEPIIKRIIKLKKVY